MSHCILIVDDEAGIRESLGSILTEEGYRVEGVPSGEEALAAVERGGIDLVLLDIWLPGIDGLDTLSRLQSLPRPPVVVMISGHGNIQSAVRATKLGAFDFIEKPLSLEKTILVVKNAIGHLRLEEENRRLGAELEKRYQVIGASEDKVGKFRKADGGTLFLDEIGDMSLKTQSKVLRVLEEQRFEPVGSNVAAKVDVRVIAATNKKLEDEIARGAFREDLFYRLNVIPFVVGPF